jgi:cyanophycinase
MAPKGKILLIGGAEERSGEGGVKTEENGGHHQRFEILKELLPSGKKGGRIEVITAASSEGEEMEKTYKSTFKEIGFNNVGFLHIDDKIQAHDQTNCSRIDNSQVVFITGGDQLRFSTVISGTDLAEKIKEKYLNDKEFIIAGTSAGAMAIPNIMISAGGVTESLIGFDLHTASGLGLLENCIVDTHFIKRGRFSRLAHAIIINPRHLGIGLGENAALLISNGKEAICQGTGMVVLIDGSDIKNTNISEAEAGTQVYVDNLRVHLMTQHCKVNLETWEMEPPSKKSKA